ncbi:unnamed protein product [Blepharisma stoltei]|uniref:K Homology domain-containing protein n=1 Tax=Blepharisma stoltei TaxID=1481888 RepID=A0AAU9K7A4_9CILI|nr:unnamed protein product [Blepharisma stoltei]
MSHNIRSSRSRSRSPLRSIPLFPLILAIPKSIINADFIKLQEKLASKCEVDRLHLASETNLPNFDEGFLYIYGPSLKGKIEILKSILSEIQRIIDRPTLELKILIPDNLIEALTGKGGKLLNKIQTNSHATITIVEEIKNLRERLIKIEGRSADVELAIKEVYRLIVERKSNSEPKSVLDKTSAKFVIPGECVGYLIGKNGLFTKRLKADYDVEIKIVKNEGLPCKDNEHIAMLLGKYRYVKTAIEIVVDKILEAIETTCSPISDLLVRMLIPTQMVKELIGPQGSIIKEISKKSGGAKIKVMCDTETEKMQDFTIVTIDGSRDLKQEAAIRIYEVISRGHKPSSPSSRRSRGYSPSPPTDNVSIFVTVPDALVSRLIGRNGDNVKGMMSRSRSQMSFQKQPSTELKTPENDKARLCTFTGSSSSIARGIKTLLDQIIKLESGRYD